MDEAAEEYLRRGFSPEEARRYARRDMGALEQQKEVLRDRRGVPLIADFGRDLRETARVIWRSSARRRRSLGIVAVVGVCLTVSVCVFAVMDGILLKPLPFLEPDRLFVVGPPHPLDPKRPFSVDDRDLHDLADAAGVSGAFGYVQEFSLGRPDRSAGVRESRVTETFFSVLGVAPELGQLLTANTVSSGERPVMIGHALWASELAADPAVVGQVVSIGTERVVVCGVMPPGFDFPAGTTMWSLTPPTSPMPFRMRSMVGVVRVASAQVPTALGLSGVPVVSVPLGRYLRPNEASSIVPLSIAAFFMVLTGLVHLAVAQATHAIDRGRETAVRSALGASRARIIRMWLFEAAALTGVAAVATALVVPRALRLLLRLLPVDLTFGQPVAIDDRVLMFGSLIALAAVGTLALAPSVLIGRTSIADLLRGRLRAGKPIPGLWRHALLGSQVAVVTALIYLGGVAFRSFSMADHADLGITSSGLLSLDWKTQSGTNRMTSEQTLAARLRQLPDVIAVAYGPSPLQQDRTLISFSLAPARTVDELRATAKIDARFVSPEYFDAVGARVVEGRGFDDALTGAVVLSQALARRISPGSSLVGHDVYLGSDKPTRVVGIVSDVRVMGPGMPPRELAYLPSRTASMGGLVVRLRGDETIRVADIATLARDTLQMTSAVTIASVSRERQRLLAPARARAVLLSLLAGISLVLGIAGVSATANETVRRRLRDAAVRVALGASSNGVALHLLSRVMSVVGIGMVGGFAGGWTGAYWARSLFYGVEPGDPVTVVFVAGVIAIGTLVAAFPPARRAATANPIALLRDDA